MATYRILHKTSYAYSYPVTGSHHTAILKPLSNETQTCKRFSLDISPEAGDLAERVDYFGNTSHLFAIQKPHDALVVEASSTVEVTSEALDLKKMDTPVGKIREALADIKRTDLIEAKEFLYETHNTKETDTVKEFGARFFSDETLIGEGIVALLQAFKDEFKFDPSASDIHTPVEQTLASKCGVCQDFAHLMIATLRSQGLSACYASGYILTMPPPGQPRLVGADASHAWVSVFIPENGWIDVDPTNNLICADQHVAVAYGRDFSDVSMLSGAVTGGGEHTVSVEVTMQPV
ncbi:transglutaminase family protein [Pelagicoccus sp. NFK12]|uniref:Transglutaminase family protein n=1 Tax=Pelagicoccus enzymogenes TaxID=2773457 RepID=A0A927FCF9_9BACT|nr:transglutaminase family protein [Pelagicoccus enzymogenes]MBD5782567.1 transglutaminase family protein [Pelagicoccus enzymogenes]MDQ8199520.1 transglutaminase family protein [Pelagicoccus enzymogenes]